MTHSTRQPNLIVVSNRLPVTVVRTDDLQNKWEFRPSSGGLVTALRGMGSIAFKWVGWTGLSVPEDEQADLSDRLSNELGHHPVFLEEQDATLYYDGFSNGILWPLFHYLNDQKSIFDEEQWSAYKRVNQQFADAVLSIYEPGDLVWIHDYHLMLAPAMLRKAHKDMKIAFFLHIPFPSSEIFRILPVRRELLCGVLACNLIGFHTYGFLRHFLSTCTRILGCDTRPSSLVWRGIKVHVTVAPIGINPKQFIDTALSDNCRARIADFVEQQYRGKRIILGIDRLDYTKGVVLKLQAFEKFLMQHPDFANNTVLVQVGVPTREDVPAYRDLISEVNELVGSINSRFGTLDGFPVHYINKSVSFVDLCALYAIADVLLVTSIRDGMNLVCQEYVAVQSVRDQGLIAKKKTDAGVLILSEFAGSARSLGGALIVNPWDLDGVASAIHKALTMGPNIRNARQQQNLKVMMRNTAEIWGRNFLSSFELACRDMDPAKCQTSMMRLVRDLPPFDISVVRQKFYQSTRKRLFLLDYDGTLVPIRKYPSLAIPDDKCLQVLKRLSNDPRNMVYVVSGRPRNVLLNFLGHLPNVGLAAEHGYFTRHPGQSEWEHLYGTDMDLSWIAEIVPFIEHLESRTPGSMLEHKESSLVFHYRNADPEYGRYQANEIKLHMEAFASHPVEIISGSYLIELRPFGVSKGSAAAKLIARTNADFIFAAGDDMTDEDMFEAVTEVIVHSSTSPSPSPSLSPSSSSSSLDNGRQYRFLKPGSIAPEGCSGVTVQIGDVASTVTASMAQCTLPSSSALLDSITELLDGEDGGK